MQSGRPARFTGVDVSRIVAEGYDAAADRYARLEEAEWPRVRWLRRLLDRLPHGSAVLDLGCGNALPAGPEVLARGHALVGVDVSARQLELACRNVPEAVFVQADMAQLELPPGAFDAVLCLYALGHVPRDRHLALLRRIRGWLGPGGWLLLSEEDSDEEGALVRWLGAEMYFSTHDAATLRALVAEAGFELVATAVEEQVEQGRAVPYCWVLAQSRPQT